MRKLIAAALAIISLQVSFAQETTGRVRIVKTNGETVSAEAVLPVSETTPQKFLYALNSRDAKIEIAAAEIKSILFFDGPYYEKQAVKLPVIGRDELKRTRMDYENKKNWLEESVMLERLLDGAVDLYQFVDRYGFPHFFYKANRDSVVTYLPNASFVENGDFRRDRSYMNLLSFLGTQSECSAVDIERLETTVYNMRGMLSAFKRINDCLGTTVDVASTVQRKKDKIRFGISAGATAFGMREKNKSGQVQDFAYNSSINPTAGIFLEITPQTSNRFALDIEVNFQKANFSSQVIPNTTIPKRDIQYTMVTLNPLAKFYFSKIPKFYAVAGLQMAYHINSYVGDHIVISSYGETRVRKTSLNGNILIGLIAGAGYKFTDNFAVQLNGSTWPGGNGRYYKYAALTGKLSL